ncbi:hypothetical protein FACS1894133_1810 [Clostridia bacterium]|nr:hypothetical protein FACS1894133_1810 [Clostridia bacterium]
MKNEYLISGAAVDLDRKFETNREVIESCFDALDSRLYLYYKYHPWLGPTGDIQAMLGLSVSREEFEYTLSKSAFCGVMSKLNDDEAESAKLIDDILEYRLKLVSEDFVLTRLFKRFNLDGFERSCVILAYAPEVDGKYCKLFSYLQDDVNQKEPLIPLAVQLYMPVGGDTAEYMSLFGRENLFTSLFDKRNMAEGVLKLRRFAGQHLSCGDITLPRGMTFYDGFSDCNDVLIDADIASELQHVASEKNVICISGDYGRGKLFQIKNLIFSLHRKCLVVDFFALSGSDDASFDTSIEDAAFIAYLTNSFLCFRNLENKDDNETIRNSLIEEIEHVASRFDLEKIFILIRKPVQFNFKSRAAYVDMPDINDDERLTLFEHYLNEQSLPNDLSLREIASKFRFTPLQIHNAAEQIKNYKEISTAEFHRCCYRQVTHNLDKLAARISPQYTWDDIMLPDEQKRLIRHACDHIKYKHKVYCEWGFDDKISYGKGLSILFSGVPGTGKTMCAQIIAKHLNMEAYRVNISQIISKYIGETEKNLNALFKEARNSDCILFFDECDALFSKRSDVKDSHDKNANAEVAYLLQLIEEYDGVCILASNLLQNIDEAFMRRITYVVNFPFPEPETRKQIYIHMLPKQLPVSDDIDWDFIAGKFKLSGGHIKNIVLSAVFAAASEDMPLCMRHVLVSAVREMKKNGIVVVREELRRYEDLIFGEL